MWSKVRSAAGRSSPQYWHSKESRRNTLKRVKAGRRSRLTYCFSEITLGSFISKLGERTTVSYSDTMFTRSRKTALMASCQDHSRSEEHTSELQSLMRISYAVFCLNKKNIMS